MLSPSERERMRMDAALAETRSYGYPEARLLCVGHLQHLLMEYDELAAALAASRGDWGPIRALPARP